MESLVKRLIKLYEPHEIKSVIFKSGLLSLPELHQLRVVPTQKDKTEFSKVLLNLSLKKGLTWKDAVLMDQLLAMSFPERVIWEPLDTDFKKQHDESFQPYSLRVSLHKGLMDRGLRLDVTVETSKNIACYRFSRPEQATCCYLIFKMPEHRFLIGNTGPCETIPHVKEVVESLSSDKVTDDVSHSLVRQQESRAISVLLPVSLPRQHENSFVLGELTFTGPNITEGLKSMKRQGYAKIKF